MVEKQRETPTVDRPPPNLALNTTASKSVQVNGATSVRAHRGGGMPRGSQKGWPHACTAGPLHRVPGPWVIIPADHCGCSSSEELRLSALVPRGSEGSLSPMPLLFLLFLSYSWLMEMTNFKCPLLSFSLHASTYLETPLPFFKLLPLTFLHHTSSPPHGRPSSFPSPRGRVAGKSSCCSRSCSCLVSAASLGLSVPQKCPQARGWKEFSWHSSSLCLLSIFTKYL